MLLLGDVMITLICKKTGLCLRYSCNNYRLSELLKFERKLWLCRSCIKYCMRPVSCSVNVDDIFGCFWENSTLNIIEQGDDDISLVLPLLR